jgi:AmiR/NasT family two-component response regulator
MPKPPKQIIAEAAKLLGVEPDNLSEEEAHKALQRSTMRTENRRMHKARNDITKKRTS